MKKNLKFKCEISNIKPKKNCFIIINVCNFVLSRYVWNLTGFHNNETQVFAEARVNLGGVVLGHWFHSRTASVFNPQRSGNWDFWWETF